MIRETFKTYEEAKARAAEVDANGAEFVAEYISGKFYVVDHAAEERDADAAGMVFNRWTEGKDKLVVVTERGKVQEYRKNGRPLPNRCFHLIRHMDGEFRRRFPQ